jgi:hypothetical protein
MKKLYKLSFLHIPKTAGISLTNQLSRYFESDSTFQVRSFSDRLKFENSNIDYLEDFDFIAGHISFNELVQKCINFPSISIVRNPIDRLNSLFNYSYTSNLDEHADKFNSNLDFITNQRILNQYNMQCWHFSENRSALSAIDCIENNNILVVPLERYDFLINSLSKILNFELVNEFDNKTPVNNFNLSPDLKVDDPLIDEDLILFNYVSNNYLKLIDRFISNLQLSCYYY